MLAKLAILLGSKGLAWTVMLLGTGFGASIIARLLNKIPLDKWYDLCRATSYGISVVLNKKLTKKIWEPLETFFEGVILGTAQAIVEGFDRDDNDPQAGTKEEPPAK